MASEISVTAKLTSTLSSVTVTNAVSTKTINTDGGAGTIYNFHDVQNVATREAVSIGDVDNSNATGVAYWLLLFNRHATSTVTVEVRVGASTYWELGVINPGEPFGPVRLAKLDANGYGGIYVTASTGTAPLEVVATMAGTPA